MVDTLRFDLCADLKLQEGVAEADQVCFGGSFVYSVFADYRVRGNSVQVGQEHVLQKLIRRMANQTESWPSFQ